MAELTLRSTLVDWATSGSRADAQSGPPVVELESSQQPATWKAQLANGSAQCAQLHRHPKARHCFCRGSTCGKCIWKDAASALPSAWLPALEQSGVVRRVVLCAGALQLCHASSPVGAAWRGGCWEMRWGPMQGGLAPEEAEEQELLAG
eukprot:1158503-Pelagomonas_calceolata.AAC.4